MSDRATVLLIAMCTAALVGALGALTVRALRGRSLRLTLAVATVTSVAAVVVGIVATAQAMFLSAHDYGVVLLVCASAGVVAVGLGLLLAGGVAADARLLQEAARALAGEASPRATPPPRTRELADVSRELLSTGRRLAQARQRERALDTSRRELVAWVSHDLRSPLAGLRAMAEALEDDVAEDPPLYFKQIRVEVDRLSVMVDDLFELSRISAGTLALSRERVAMADLVSDTLAGTQALARARGVRLTGAAGDAVVVAGDPAGLSRVLTNLVVNAIRHTPPDATVDVRLLRSLEADGGAVLTVQDQCGGIPPDDLPRVFEVAWRGTSARTPGPDGGAGLGLAIVRGIVTAHDGTVSVRNAGGGCRFEVRLPEASPNRP